MGDYQAILSGHANEKAALYLNKLASGDRPGAFLSRQVGNESFAEMSVEGLWEHLCRTKRPRIFAESEVAGDGSDWNLEELSLLGDLNIVSEVTIFDNGLHKNPSVFSMPWQGFLFFTPGALLRNGMNQAPADWHELVHGGSIDANAYYDLYERRLLPIFSHADKLGQLRNKPVLITIPGLGCGQFAGPFQGQLGVLLGETITKLLQQHGRNFSNIDVVYYDPYGESRNQRHVVEGINFLVRPLTMGNEGKPQLCRPETYEESGDAWANHLFCSLVAWDHVSWPGNDYYDGLRVTDDGVKAAATNVMTALTGVGGSYNLERNAYLPPQPYSTWGHLVESMRIQLKVRDQLLIY